MWTSDGTAEGTVSIKDIQTEDFININGILYFYSGYNGELWKSDGTAQGTTLVKNFNPENSSYDSQPSLTNLNGILYFSADDGTHGWELWKSDGTAEGTVLVKDINPGSGSSSISELINFNGVLYFSANDGIHGQELWKSDGTAEGTVIVQDIYPGVNKYNNLNSSNPSYLTAVGGILYFNADDGIHGTELWAIDTNPTINSPIISITVIDRNASEVDNDSAIFRISRIGDINDALEVKYTIDGTATNGSDYNQLNGTVTIAAGESFADIAIAPLEDIIREGSETVTLTLFKHQTDYAVDTSNITATAIVADDTNTAIVTQPYLVKYITPIFVVRKQQSTFGNFTNIDGILYFNNDNVDRGNYQWKSDGTKEGTVPVKGILASDSASNLISINGSLYFTTYDDGTKLWKSDGTEEGTILLKNMPTSNLIGINNTLYFFGFDSSEQSYKLWKSDGTTEGTVLIKDINFGSDDYAISQVINVNGILYFFGNKNNVSQLWKSDGTTEGTVLVKNIDFGSNGYNIPGAINVNGIFYFFGRGNNIGQLWKSDGTTESTVLVKEINFWLNYYDFPEAVNVNGTLYFIADDGINGREVWKSDGTTEGTVLVKDIIPESVANYPTNLTNVNGVLYFTADDGIHGREVWKSDGTTEGTVLVKDINPGLNDNSNGYYPNNLTNVNGVLYFTADDGIHGQELWRSDGTEEGTFLVADIKQGAGGSRPYNLTNVNDTLFFVANDGINDYQLWALNPNLTQFTPVVSITANDFNAAEGGDNSATFRISRTGEVDTALAVQYTISGTATNGSDYTQLTGIASIAVGQYFVDITINPIDDDLAESSETVTLTLSEQSDYEINTSSSVASVTIFDRLNIINGDGSRDPLIGTAGSDRIVGGTGSKTIIGGEGNDEFVYTDIREVGHRITDFTVGSDQIVLTSLLDRLSTALYYNGYNGNDAIADGYVRLVQGKTANSTILQIDRDGPSGAMYGGNAIFRNFIELDNLTPQQMNNSSNFVF